MSSLFMTLQKRHCICPSPLIYDLPKQSYFSHRRSLRKVLVVFKREQYCKVFAGMSYVAL